MTRGKYAVAVIFRQSQFVLYCKINCGGDTDNKPKNEKRNGDINLFSCNKIDGVVYCGHTVIKCVNTHGRDDAFGLNCDISQNKTYKKGKNKLNNISVKQTENNAYSDYTESFAVIFKQAE